MSGRLFGVGVGPGDPELLTRKAARIIGAAHVVAYHAARHGRSNARAIVAAELRPDFPEALIAVAKLRSDAKRYPEAIGLLERAIKLQPRNETAHYNLMMAYRNAGRAADAQREKTELDKLQKPPEGEFTDFLKRLGDKK